MAWRARHGQANLTRKSLRASSCGVMAVPLTPSSCLRVKVAIPGASVGIPLADIGLNVDVTVSGDVSELEISLGSTTSYGIAL
jgi:hypothetical protein